MTRSNALPDREKIKEWGRIADSCLRVTYVRSPKHSDFRLYRSDDDIVGTQLEKDVLGIETLDVISMAHAASQELGKNLEPWPPDGMAVHDAHQAVYVLSRLGRVLGHSKAWMGMGSQSVGLTHVGKAPVDFKKKIQEMREYFKNFPDQEIVRALQKSKGHGHEFAAHMLASGESVNALFNNALLAMENCWNRLEESGLTKERLRDLGEMLLEHRDEVRRKEEAWRHR